MHYFIEISIEPAAADALRTLIVEAGEKFTNFLSGERSEGCRMEGSWVALDSGAAYLVLDTTSGKRLQNHGWIFHRRPTLLPIRQGGNRGTKHEKGDGPRMVECPRCHHRFVQEVPDASSPDGARTNTDCKARYRPAASHNRKARSRSTRSRRN
jgi:hypothetical protein